MKANMKLMLAASIVLIVVLIAMLYSESEGQPAPDRSAVNLSTEFSKNRTEEVETVAAYSKSPESQDGDTQRISVFETIDPALVDDTVIQEQFSGPALNRYRLVSINTNLLRTYMRGEGVRRELFLSLFDDVTLMGIPNHVQEYHEGPRSGFASWRGSVEGDMESLMSVVTSPSGETAIDISSSKGTYRVLQIPGSQHHIVLDLSTKTSYKGDTVKLPKDR